MGLHATKLFVMRLVPRIRPFRLCSFVVAGALLGCGSPDPSGGASTGAGPGKKDSPKEAPEKGEPSGPEQDDSTQDSPKDEPDNSPEASPEDQDPGDESPEDEGAPKFDLGNDGGEDMPKEEIGCDIDFLFVVDNSVSMTDNQKSLTDSVPDFITTITTEIPDLESYHIGVISTDENRFNGTEDTKNCATMGGLVTRTVDYSEFPFEDICAPYAGGKNFMTKDDDLTDKFTCAAGLGAMGSGNKRPMDALAAAFSKEISEPGACNEGFFRKNAILVVVLVTDEEDDIEVEDGFDNGSKGEPEDWYKAVMKFKGNRPEYVVMLSLLGNPKPNACDWTYEPGGEPKDEKGTKSAEVSRRLIEFTKKFKTRGVVGDVCADSYKDFFQKAVSVLKLSCSEAPK